MNTNRTCATIGVLIWLAQSQTALGFYNPSTGRWLSRDPIEEDGGVNVYGFLANAPQKGVDLYGLCDDDVICGKDITASLNKVLDEVNSRFDSWSRANQDLACRHLVYSDLGANNAWDIRELKLLGAEGLEGCDRQVTFQGRCYYGSAANYALFGRAMRKCHQAFPRRWWHTLDAAIAAVVYHKMHARGGYYGNTEAMQAVPFTRYGWYYGSSTSTGALWFHFTCAPESETDTRTFGWRWQHLKPDYDK